MRLNVSLFLLCMLLIASANAQNWGGGVDDDNIHFGFTFQYVSSEYKIIKKGDWRTNPFYDPADNSFAPTLNAVSAKPSAGFGIGFVVNKRLSENADVRLTPMLVFNDRIVSYQYTNASLNIDRKVQATLVEFPLGIKIKSDRRKDFRAYLLGGAKYSIDITSKKKTNNELVTDPAEKILNNKRKFLSYEAGLGFDLYFEYFKMSPEVKLSYSFDDVLRNEPHRYAAPIDKLLLRQLTFSLFFE